MRRPKPGDEVRIRGTSGFRGKRGVAKLVPDAVRAWYEVLLDDDQMPDLTRFAERELVVEKRK